MRKLLFIFAFILLITSVKPESSQAQTCTTTPPTNTGTSTMTATTTDGTYRVWGRMKAADTNNNSFYLRIDSQCAILVGDNNQISASSWTWVDYQNGVTTNKINTTLTTGNHVVTIIGNESEVSVDKILMTKDLTCVPTGFGDNCPAETPTSTPTPSPSDTTPPTISNVVTTNITNSSANIQWNLSEGGTGQVEYGTTVNYGSVSVLETGFLTFHSQTISNLTPGTLYHYKIKSKDAANNTAISEDKTFTTTGGITLTPTPTLRPSSTPTPTNIPTPTPTPIITATSQEIILKFSTVKLHGIGTGGDNTNPNLTGNTNPLTPTRVVTIELYDTAGALVKSVQGNIVYSANVGYFSGDIKLDSSTIEGDYLIKIKTDKYLKKQLSGVIRTIKGAAIQMPEVTLVVGDSNGDGALSILDYNVILDCYSDLLPPKNCSDPNKKINTDLSDDGKVNQDDYNLFLRELSVISGD